MIQKEESAYTYQPMKIDFRDSYETYRKRRLTETYADK